MTLRRRDPSGESTEQLAEEEWVEGDEEEEDEEEEEDTMEDESVRLLSMRPLGRSLSVR